MPPPPPRPGASPMAFLGRAVWDPSSPLKAIQAKAALAKVKYNAGLDPGSAAELAKASDVAIVFVNQPTSEGWDVPSLSLPHNQDQLVSAVAAANPHTIVVLETGDPVTMPWIDKVSAVLEAWYPGIRGADAISNILFGDVNPSAKLPVTFPRAEADLPHRKLTQQPPAREADLVAPFPGSRFRMNTRRFEVDYDGGPEGRL